MVQNINQYTEIDFRNFINLLEWTFAKTYAQKGPHEYVVLKKVGLHFKEEFIKIAQFIRDKGFKALYYSREGFYYRIDENYYWTMDEKAEDTDLDAQSHYIFSHYITLFSLVVLIGRKIEANMKA